MERLKRMLENPNSRQNYACNQIHLHTSTPRVIPLVAIQKWSCYACGMSLHKQIKIQDHSPSMTLSNLPFKMILVPPEEC